MERNTGAAGAKSINPSINFIVNQTNFYTSKKQCINKSRHVWLDTIGKPKMERGLAG